MAQIESRQVESFLGQFGDSRSDLISILQEVQASFHYLPQPILKRVSEKLDVSLPDVYHVATFYNCFSLEPVGDHLVQVCLGTACHVRGGPRVLDRLLRELKLPAPGTTQDMAFTVRTVRCIGCCGLAPVVRVDDRVHPHLTQAKVGGLVKKYRQAAAAKNGVKDATKSVQAEIHRGA